MTSNLATDSGAYWQDYYAKRRSTSIPVPSQFAVFVAGEMHEPHQVFDIGCGSGRDSVFFASHGHAVTGVDGSQAAVDNCRHLAASIGLESIRFECAQVGGAAAAAGTHSDSDKPTLVYARFFLHAITDADEELFFDAARALTHRGGRLAVEFRTMRDAAQEKVTDAHYRRFIDPVMFHSRALEAGFAATYFVEGFGFAKYRNDDAHVARFIFDRRPSNAG